MSETRKDFSHSQSVQGFKGYDSVQVKLLVGLIATELFHITSFLKLMYLTEFSNLMVPGQFYNFTDDKGKSKFRKHTAGPHF